MFLLDLFCAGNYSPLPLRNILLILFVHAFLLAETVVSSTKRKIHLVTVAKGDWFLNQQKEIEYENIFD